MPDVSPPLSQLCARAWKGKRAPPPAPLSDTARCLPAASCTELQLNRLAWWFLFVGFGCWLLWVFFPSLKRSAFTSTGWFQKTDVGGVGLGAGSPLGCPGCVPASYHGLLQVSPDRQQVPKASPELPGAFGRHLHWFSALCFHFVYLCNWG